MVGSSLSDFIEKVMDMPVRVRLRITSKDGKTITTSAYVNSGYETDQPELLIPLRLAEELEIWSPIAEECARTSLGLGRVYIVCRKAVVEVVTDDRVSPHVEVCITVSKYEREVLISDYLASELKIAVEDSEKGCGDLGMNHYQKLRKSEPPQYWI